MYITCVILRLFSALSRGVHALQISVIIINDVGMTPLPHTFLQARALFMLCAGFFFLQFNKNCMQSAASCTTDSAVKE